MKILFLLIAVMLIMYKLPKYAVVWWKKYNSPYRSMSIKEYKRVLRTLKIGNAGEDITYGILNGSGKKYRIYRNLFVPTENGTTELDMVLLHKKAVIVIENKNWDGKVYGGEYDNYWYSYPRDTKRKPVSHFNPVEQNERHCRRLYEYLGDKLISGDKIESLVVFNKSDISELDIKERSTYIATSDMLLKTVKYILRHNRGKIRKSTLRKIGRKLENCMDDEKGSMKREHINNIVSQRKTRRNRRS